MFKVWYRDFFVWSHYFGASLVANLGEPLLYLFALGYGVGKYVTNIQGMSYSEFIAPALVVASVMNSATFETTYSSYTRMTGQKTFDAIAVTPVTFQQIVLGEILWATTKACLSAITILIVFAIAGVIKNPMAIAVLPLCFIEGLVFASLGMLATSKATNYDFFTYYFILFISPMFLFSGTFFPLQGTGAWLQYVTWMLPLTHAVNGARELFQGKMGWALWSELLWLLVVASLLCTWAVRRMVKRLYV